MSAPNERGGQVEKGSAGLDEPFFQSGVQYLDRTLPAGWRPAIDLLPRGNGWLLDLGCGGGKYHEAILAKGWHWIGVDLVREPGEGPPAVIADACFLPFWDEAFDAVFANCALEHFADPWRALKEARRVLTRDGLLCGAVAFLEPFHRSYYHFSHWGLERALGQAGFGSITMQPGPSVFTLLGYYLFRGRPRCIGWFGRVGWLLLKAMEIIARGYAWATSWRDPGRPPRVAIWFRHQVPFMLAGHLNFSARLGPMPGQERRP